MAVMPVAKHIARRRVSRHERIPDFTSSMVIRTVYNVTFISVSPNTYSTTINICDLTGFPSMRLRASSSHFPALNIPGSFFRAYDQERKPLTNPHADSSLRAFIIALSLL